MCKWKLEFKQFLLKIKDEKETVKNKITVKIDISYREKDVLLFFDLSLLSHQIE